MKTPPHAEPAFFMLIAAMAASVVGPIGCGNSGPSRFQLSGCVQYEGKPVPFGEISFQPDASQGNQGPGSTARIEDGRYVTQAGQGVQGGPYVVRILHIPRENERAGTIEPLWFSPFETKVDLPAEEGTRDFEVARQGAAKR